MKRTAVAVRDGWLIFGIVAALCVGLELLYRAQGAVRRGLSGPEPTAVSPLAAQPWYADYLAERDQSFALRWEPYVYHRRQPMSGDHINVDSAGHRRTVQSAPPSARRSMYFFGGSTMFGSFQRDGGTIPSVTARMLDALDVDDVHVTNFGETGYVSMQEALALLLALRDGERPDVVVFYDGINDVAAAVQSGHAGLPLNETNRAREFQLGRTVFDWRADLPAETRALTAIGGLVLSRSQLVSRVLALKERPGPGRDAEALARQVLESYAATTRLVATLADRYGFAPVFVWQPTIHTTGKPLSPYETELRRAIESDAAFHLMADIHARAAADIDSVMATQGGERFINASRVLDTLSVPIYTDTIGHTVEAANPAIVASLMPALLSGLQARSGKRGGRESEAR